MRQIIRIDFYHISNEIACCNQSLHDEAMTKAALYLLQAALIVGWWIGLMSSDSFFALFQFPGIESVAFHAFFLPDIVVIAGVSVLRFFKRGRSLEWIVLGGFAYATLFCIHASILTVGGWLSTSLMLVGLIYNLVLCYYLTESKDVPS